MYQILEIIIDISVISKSIGNHVWNSPLCKLHVHKWFDSYMSHSITVFPEFFFIRDVCLIRDDYSYYTVFNNSAITKRTVF